MHFRSGILSVVSALFVAGCSAASLPAAPSALIAVQSAATAPTTATHRSLVGAWRGFVSSKAFRAGSDIAVGFALNCSQTWEITTQSGGHFEGQMSSQGNGPESDWRCTQTRRFTGDITSDDRVTVSFVPEFKVGGCANAAGSGTATGSLSADSIVMSLPYRAICDMAPVVGPSWDLDITATLTLTPR